MCRFGRRPERVAMRIPFLSDTRDGAASSGGSDIARLQSAALRGRTGLSRGERAFAAAAVALRRGNHADAMRQGREAARLLRDTRSVDLLLEEGFPSPLTRRLGALAGAAAGLAAVPPRISAQDLSRLSIAGILPEEMLDLVLTCAVSGLEEGVRHLADIGSGPAAVPEP